MAARHGSGEHFLLLANLFECSLGLGCVRDDRGFAVHVDSTPTAANLHLVGPVHGVVQAEAKNAIVLHDVLTHHHVVLVLQVDRICLVFGALRALEVAVDAHLACTAARHERRWLSHIHASHRIEDGTLLHQVIWLHQVANERVWLIAATEAPSPRVDAVRGAK